MTSSRWLVLLVEHDILSAGQVDKKVKVGYNLEPTGVDGLLSYINIILQLYTTSGCLLIFEFLQVSQKVREV